jgi:hypothetical protein
MPAEPETHGGQHLLGESVLLAGTEADKQRCCQDLRWDRFFHRGFDRPSFASADDVRSSSQDVTTDPRRQTSAISPMFKS